MASFGSKLMAATVGAALVIMTAATRAECLSCRQIEYQASSGMPQAPCFVRDSGPGNVFVIHDELELSSSSGQLNFFATSDILPFRWADGLTLEVKLRVAYGSGAYTNSGGFRGAAAVTALDSDYQTYGLIVWSEGLAFTSNYNFTPDPTTLTVIAFDAASASHVYTIVSDAGGANLLIDGIQRLHLPKGAADTHNAPRFVFGIDSRFGPSVTEWASLRLTLRAGCPADLDCDSAVGDSDFSIFAAAYNLLVCSDPAMPPSCPSDLNGDGQVDDADFILFVVAYDHLTCP